MVSFSIQFHATLDELIDFLETWMDRYAIHAVAVHKPFRAEPISIPEAREIVSQPSVRSIVLTALPANLSAATGNELLDKNPGSLVLDVGRMRERGLEESCLNTMDASATWKKIATDLKRRTTAGAVGVHETTGAVARYRNRRFTTGAKALAEQGTALRQFAQLPVVFRPE